LRVFISGNIRAHFKVGLPELLAILLSLQLDGGDSIHGLLAKVLLIHALIDGNSIAVCKLLFSCRVHSFYLLKF
jgi:hypothetical protein